MEDKLILKRTLIVTIIISAAILIGSFILSRSGIYIQNLGSSLIQEGRLVNTISVSGDGKIYAKPDMATVEMSISETADTSAEALGKLNAKIDTLLSILKSNGMEEKDLQSSNLSIYPEYEYSNNITRVIGQKASQSITVSVKNLDEKGEKAAKIIDAVSVVDNVNLGSVKFDIEDKTELYGVAREEAFNKAKLKAEDLAGLAGVQLLKPVSIVDSNVEYSAPVSYERSLAMDSVANASSTQLPTGELQVSISVSVIFGIQ